MTHDQVILNRILGLCDENGKCTQKVILRTTTYVVVVEVGATLSRDGMTLEIIQSRSPDRDWHFLVKAEDIRAVSWQQKK
jgi:hypothetical protein